MKLFGYEIKKLEKSTEKCNNVKVGEVWEYANYSKNPFTEIHKVDIREIRDGWVRYGLLGNPYSSVERIKDFIWLYKKECKE